MDKVKEKKSELYDLIEQQAAHRQQIDSLQQRIVEKQEELNKLKEKSGKKKR